MQTKGQDTLKEEEDENMNNSVTLKLTWGCSLSLLNFGEEGWEEKCLCSTGGAEKEPI